MSIAFPNKIAVLQRDWLLDTVKRHPGRATVICCEREPLDLASFSRHFLLLPFDDLTLAQHAEAEGDSRLKNMVLPTQADVEKAISFARLHQAQTIFICCHAAVSRSPAIAWSILYDRTKDIKAATEQLFKVSPFSLPHRDIIKYALRAVNPAQPYEEADALLKQFEDSKTPTDTWLNPL
jgi:predicted protein tyrosine phosphatase